MKILYLLPLILLGFIVLIFNPINVNAENTSDSLQKLLLKESQISKEWNNQGNSLYTDSELADSNVDGLIGRAVQHLTGSKGEIILDLLQFKSDQKATKFFTDISNQIKSNSKTIKPSKSNNCNRGILFEQDYAQICKLKGNSIVLIIGRDSSLNPAFVKSVDTFAQFYKIDQPANISKNITTKIDPKPVKKTTTKESNLQTKSKESSQSTPPIILQPEISSLETINTDVIGGEFGGVIDGVVAIKSNSGGYVTGTGKFSFTILDPNNCCWKNYNPTKDAAYFNRYWVDSTSFETFVNKNTGKTVTGYHWQINLGNIKSVKNGVIRIEFESGDMKSVTDIKLSDLPIYETMKKTLNPYTIKKGAIDASYDSLNRNNDNYIGKIIHTRGIVIQTIQMDDNKQSAIVGIDLDNNLNYAGKIWLNNKESQRVLEGDIINLYGQVMGLKTYTTVLGSPVTVPEIDSWILEVQN